MMISIFQNIIPGGISVPSLLATIVVLVIVWMIDSIPVYIAGKILAGEKATFGRAMVATLLGPIVFYVVLVVIDFLLGGIIGGGAYIWSLVLAFIAWVGVYKSTFKTGWLTAFGIALLAIVIFVILSLIVNALFGTIVPSPFHTTI
jgi:hypothetical protein